MRPYFAPHTRDVAFPLAGRDCCRWPPARRPVAPKTTFASKCQSHVRDRIRRDEWRSILHCVLKKTV